MPLVLPVVELGREVGDLVPGGLVRHGQALGLEEVLAIHREGRLAIEGLAVDLALVAEGLRHRLHDVALVEGGVAIGLLREVGDPAVLGIDRDLEVRERGDVILTRLRRELLADLVADVILRHHGVVDLDARGLGEVVGRELLQVDHLRVVHHEHVDGAAATAAAAAALAAATTGARAAGQPRGHDRRCARDCPELPTRHALSPR